MKEKIQKILTIFTILFLPSLIFAQPKTDAERLWELGDKAYQEKRYKEAIYYYEQSLARCGGNDYECSASNYNGLGSSYEDMGNDEKALFYYEKAIAAARKLDNKEWLADDLFLAGSIYNRKAIDYEKAYRYLLESKKLFSELAIKDSLAIVFHELGKSARALGKYEEAIQSFNESARLYREKGDHFSIGANMSQIGLVYSKMGQYEKALSYYEESLKIAKQYKNYEAMSIAMREIADAYFDLHYQDKAISYYLEAIEIQKKHSLKGELGITLNNLGTLYMDLGRYEKALSQYIESHKISEELNDKATKATNLNNIGQVYAKLGMSDKALAYYQQSLEIEKQLKRPDYLAYVLNNIGMEYFRVGKYNEALQYLKEALEIDKKLNNPYLLETRLNNIGAVYLRQGKYREAEQVFLERKKLEDMIKPNRMFHPGLVEVYLLTGRYDDALKLAQELPPSWRDNTNRYIEYYTQVGLATKGKGLYKDSAEYFVKAINIIEETRKAVSNRTHFYIGGGYYSRLTPYRSIVSVLSNMNKKGDSLISNLKQYGNSLPSVAFYFSELTKAKTLLEAMTGALKKVKKDEIPAYLKVRENELLRNLSFIDSKWEDALKKGEKAITDLQKRREGIKKELDSLINELRQKYPRYAALNYPMPIKAEELPLKENEVLFEYAITDDATYLFIVKKGGIKKLVKIPVTKENLEESIKAFIEPINIKKIDRFSVARAKKLYEILLLEALKDIVENEKIIIVPDGILGILPFESLIIKEGSEFNSSIYVADRYSITYYQSATILALNRFFKGTQPRKTLFAIGNPVYSPDDPRYIAWKHGKTSPIFASSGNYSFRGLAIKSKWGAVTEEDQDNKIIFPPLPETEIEVKEIARIMGIKPEPPDILLGVLANETNLRLSGLENYRYIHFATHASLPGMIQGINEPFILLGQVENRENDGFLTLSEVAGMKLNADIVVLSACVTGIGKEVEGEGVLNFARAFQQAGAMTVIVSLWEVASEPAVEYMKILYSHLKSGKTKEEALKLTRTLIKEKYPNPFYWAVFILHGEGE